jgi:hypothetical protein
MRKQTFFGDLSGPGWPAPRELWRYFADPNGEAWPRSGGNDECMLSAEGLYGTESLPRESDRVDVYLVMTGYPPLGVTLQYARWDGRTKERIDFKSEGDPSRLKEIVCTMQSTPHSAGTFVPFADAYEAVKEFIETEGELPTSIRWTTDVDIPVEAFFHPKLRR